MQVDKQISAMLLLGLFISRALVSTLLLKPVECGLMEATPSNLAASNLKVRKRCVTLQVARPLACKTFGLYVLIREELRLVFASDRVVLGVGFAHDLVKITSTVN